MSNYLGMETVKPSKPIKRGDLYVFPKTTASQVIVNEDTDDRLDKTIGCFSNANLLVNGDFKINQRGKTSYDNSKSSIVYTVDRWRINGLTVTVNADGSVTVANTNAENARNFMQVFDDHLMDEVYTASCKVKSVSGQARMFYGSFGNNLVVGVNKFTFPKASMNMFIIQLAVGASVTLEWVKLEQGSVATPFVAPLPSDELIRCGSPDDSSESGYKAGFLSESDVVDNLESDRSDLPLSARMGSELNKNLSALGGFTPIIDETGKITGYKTSVGGADTVFPFTKPSFLSADWTKSTPSGMNATVVANDDCAMMRISGMSDGNTALTSKLTSPLIDITDYSLLEISYYSLKPTTNAGTHYTPKIILQDSSGSNIKTIYQHSTSSSSNSAGMYKIDVDLTAYTGEHRLQLTVGGYGSGDNKNIGSVICLAQATLS